MALWGNKDNIDSTGTVTVNHANLTVAGSGTSFGQVGSASTGDVIRFGQAFGGVDGYSGDAVIVSIASTLECGIDGISGLSGGEIVDSAYQINQCPKSHTLDAAANQRSASDSKRQTKYSGIATAVVAIGATIIQVDGNPSTSAVVANDHVIVKHGKDDREQMGKVFAVTSNTITLKNPVLRTTFHYRIRPDESYSIGDSIIELEETILNGIRHPLIDITPGDSFHKGSNSIGIGTVVVNDLVRPERAVITLNTPLTQAIAGVEFFGSPAQVRRGIANGSKVIVKGKEPLGTVETQVVGVSTDGSQASQKTQFETGVGWVGVSTYNDSDGNLRVKKEILVAMSGIQTGNAPIYDGNPFA